MCAAGIAPAILTHSITDVDGWVTLLLLFFVLSIGHVQPQCQHMSLEP